MRNTVQRDIHQDLDRDPTRELFQWSASRSWAMDVMDLRKECRCIVYVIALLLALLQARSRDDDWSAVLVTIQLLCRPTADLSTLESAYK